MSTLRIFLFGRFRVEHESPTVEVRLIPTVQNLLAYILVNHHRSHPREIIAELAWGDRPQRSAQNCLNTAVWRLRRELEPDGIPRGTYLSCYPNGEIGFNWDSDHWLDLEIFETQALKLVNYSTNIISENQAKILEEAVQLYLGDLLEGLYSDWVLGERERLRNLYIKCLARLLEYHKTNLAYEPAILYGQQILRHDPLREEIHRELMRLFWFSGQRVQAIQEYETCRRTLADELGILPMPETRQLFDEIIQDANSMTSAKNSQRTCAQGEQSELEHARQQLQIAARQLESARQEVLLALDTLDHFKST